MKIAKTLGYLAIASFLAFAPIKTYAQSDSFSVKIEFPEVSRELAYYMVELATDINDDGIQDREGYETLLTKLGMEYKPDQNLEEYQKQIENYIQGLKTDKQFEGFGNKTSQMLTEKDYGLFFERFMDKSFEIMEELLDGLVEKLPEIEKELNKK